MIAGILDIAYGIATIGLILWRADWDIMLANPLWLLSMLFIGAWALSGILAIVGGIFAIMRKLWPLSLAGSIASCFAVLSLPIALPALILTILSRKEFGQNS